MELEFIDPPPPLPPRPGDHRPGQVTEWIEELKKHPNLWARYKRDLSASAACLYRKRYPDIEWRFVIAPEQRGTSRRNVYGIYRVEDT